VDPLAVLTTPEKTTLKQSLCLRIEFISFRSLPSLATYDDRRSSNSACLLLVSTQYLLKKESAVVMMKKIKQRLLLQLSLAIPANLKCLFLVQEVLILDKSSHQKLSLKKKSKNQWTSPKTNLLSISLSLQSSQKSLSKKKKLVFNWTKSTQSASPLTLIKPKYSER
jgi:hypothetical protein